MKYWISWWDDVERLPEFERQQPWWTSGEDDEGRVSLCTAAIANSEQEAKDQIRSNYDYPPESLDWRFIQERPEDWSPFNSRFQKASWMEWEDG